MASNIGSGLIRRALPQCRIVKSSPPPIPSPRLPSSPTTCLRSYSAGPSSPQPKKSKTLRRTLIFGAAIGSIWYYLATPSQPKATTLNDTTFVPYTITSRTNLSPSSFVLTVSPETPNPNPPYLLPGTNRWRHPLWSVEFKQPEVQISRHYTPLPPSSSTNPTSADAGKGGEHADEADGSLRFYIRAIDDGEMSRYLNRLRVGQPVHLRGPHVGFDLVHRLGASKNIVFLAGGTGIAPGLQAARVALDGYEDTRVSLLWAVRHRGEIQSARPKIVEPSWWDFGWRGSEPAELDVKLEGPSPVAKQLSDMKRRYGDRLSVKVVVDDENSAFRPEHVQSALASLCEGETTLSNPGTGCSLHDQKIHERAPEFEAEPPACRCAPVEGALPGKNLFIVSGPDGFVTHYAGAKEWRGGQQIQGRVGGIVAEVQRRNPQLARDWLVLKL
ncbi:Cytochrome c mitochondrial import factor-like protein [Hapsidospora chrysogenum ATCC 11550]|uniref:Cytochrome c mitochondrial import factor-like protein n=1 Tax=Hapsidospora chrysogenum (strain ATCC 11550 / CBS 779.69 / DSM 880 / IAM 14645 / JCM 23072 / IMI 49137) TaxID=857340 RepID=A0A086TC64_HAPC1|nr:Cytochrome c mitochondrial import factor-like protein [Hapsidospora chrysogenum ATCC 11550]